MDSTKRWMILGGVVGAVVVSAVFIVLLTRPPATITAEFEGVVASGDHQAFTLKDVQTQDSRVSLCSRDNLAVRVERTPVAITIGDRVAVKGEYSEKACQIIVKTAEHAVRVVAPAPAAIALEGVVARAGQESFTLGEVTVFSGPQPCSLERLVVQVESRDLISPSALHAGDLVTVKGDYHAEDCTVRLNAPTHYVELRPVPIKLQGTVAQVSSDHVILQGVKVLEGPQPCTTENLTVRVRGAANLRSGEGVEVVGEYDPQNCRVSVGQPTHSFVPISAPPVPTPQPPLTPPPTQPPIPTGGLPFFISGGVSAIGPVLAFRGSVGMAFNSSIKGMLSLGYGSGSMQKPELTKPVNFTVIPIDFTVWYGLGGGLHIGGGAGVFIVQGPKPKFSNTVPTVHIAVGFAISGFLMLSGGIAYVP